ncbi:hypothetical protein GCM10011505_33550 [Tistrella bauzanensis]|uniref:Nucleotidyltransferase n=1 Tax=Tistrella bauzanensis TaxID=657419 RepID=A0ABQ1IQ34_9PROT|nr:nucleotidyltransferase domain-containing protein [Tistrella bauzanensis]GGB49760.1 hypothetical protein GCM10011505_33550 [Tistrella bauzanensis]
MSLRQIAPDMDPVIVGQIDRRLDALCSDHRVTIPLAIESGSRAWGFPSPDSDYDCRFVYVRSLDQYLTPWPPRDVIETPLDAIFDVNGWDLGKALHLLVKGNAVILEWLMSPVIYRGDNRFRQAFLDLAERHANPALIARHYLHLGEHQRATAFGDGRSVPQKKIFYALRPAMALRWLRLHPQAQFPPMQFQTLMSEGEVPAEVRAVAEALLARKTVSHELGSAPLDPVIGAFIDSEFTRARTYFPGERVAMPAEAKEDAAAFFHATVLSQTPALAHAASMAGT